MFLASLRHLYRDRRRMALAAAILLASSWFGRDTLPDFTPAVHTELLTTLGLLAAIPLITLILPRRRHWIEVVLVGMLLFLGLGALFPHSAFAYGGPWGFGLPISAAFWGCVAIARVALYGHWSDRYLNRISFTQRAQAHSLLDRRSLWYGLVPTPGHLDKNPDPDIVSIDYADASHRIIRLVTWMPPRALGETWLHIDEIEPFQHIRFRLDVRSGMRDAGFEGATRIEIEERHHMRQAIMSHAYVNLPLRRALRFWLDDTLGRSMDARLAAVERGVNRAQGRQARRSLPSWFDESTEVGGPAAWPVALYQRPPTGKRERAARAPTNAA